MQLRKSIPSVLSEKHNGEYDQQCSNDSLALVFSSSSNESTLRTWAGKRAMRRRGSLQVAQS